ncbi:MAG: hypothetical protein CM1200mP3_09900 [Chloroflexota bacterium]|nr:MAG: hypothetical protein CM1200mP3_09900 [Chloroflexota bacterium]
MDIIGYQFILEKMEHSMTNKDWEILIIDDQMAQFIINGYMILETGVGPTINETIIKELNKLDSNPRDLVTDSVPLLKEI